MLLSSAWISTLPMFLIRLVCLVCLAYLIDVRCSHINIVDYAVLHLFRAFMYLCVSLSVSLVVWYVLRWLPLFEGEVLFCPSLLQLKESCAKILVNSTLSRDVTVLSAIQN